MESIAQDFCGQRVLLTGRKVREVLGSDTIQRHRMRLSLLLLRRSVEIMIEINRAVGWYGVPGVCGQTSVDLFDDLPNGSAIHFIHPQDREVVPNLTERRRLVSH